MSYLWRTDNDGQWVKTRLDGDLCTLTSAPSWTASRPPEPGETALARLRPEDTGLPGAPQWIVSAPLAGSARPVRVNGLAVTAGLRMVSDRDEICVPGLGRCFLSTWEPAVHVSYPGLQGGDARCPRCQSVIAPGSPAVRCGSCGLWHHQTDDLPCWTHAETCACGHPTTSERAADWRPEEA